MDFCQNQASGIHFHLPGIELRQPPKTICYGRVQQSKTFPYVSRIITVRLPYTMHVDAKNARCWKYPPGDQKSLFPPGSTFQPNREAVSTGLVFVYIICTQPVPTLPILIEKKKNHQITLPKGRIGFSSLDVIDKEEPNYQIRNPYELTNAIITTDDKYNDCFFYTQRFPYNLQMIVYKKFTVPRIQYCNNHSPLGIVSQEMLRSAKDWPTFFHNEFLDFKRHADGQNYCQYRRSYSGTALAIDIYIYTT